MKRTTEYCTAVRPLAGFALAAALALTAPSLAAAPVALATEPLTSTTGSNVKPNIMFILDDSGTMAYDYLPDWVNTRSPYTDVVYVDMPELFTNSGFNGVAYNPTVTYAPPVLYTATGALDTTTYPSYSTAASWKLVKRDGFGVLDSSNEDNLVGNASYYTFIEGEYCSSIKKTVCVPATAKIKIGSVDYDTAAGLRWCNNAGLTNCQSINTSTFKYPRYPGEIVPARATITVTKRGSVKNIKVNGAEILSATTSSTASGTASTAVNIVNGINACTSVKTGNCTVAGYSAIRLGSGSVVTIFAPVSAGAITYSVNVTNGTATNTTTDFAGYTTVPGENKFVNIVSTTGSYPYPPGGTKAASTRTDCSTSAPCTYAQEMTNYANWWAYYHTRLQAMKSSVSRAFKTVDHRFRVGFSTICNTTATTGTDFLANDTFELAQKNNWYKKLFATGKDCWTPLRGALSKTGQYYAHKVGTVDPVQYACQKNFAILSTDGYWNTNKETSTFGPFDVKGSKVGDLDFDLNDRLAGKYQGPTATADSLADVARYYFDNDLRRTDLSNCTGGKTVLNEELNVCEDATGLLLKHTKQNMTTYTMGLGADGLLNFQPDYETAESGDFHDLRYALGSPVTNWPVPAANSPSAIDDLWHAAINGDGQYFSAKDPDQIITGFKKMLDDINTTPGAGAAAATSTLNPVAGNNFAYLASYSTAAWTGNLEAREIDSKGAVSDDAKWCVESIDLNKCKDTDKQQIPPLTGAWYCVVSNATVGTCASPPGIFDDSVSPATCTTPITNTCTGSMTRPPTTSSVVSATADNRRIYTANDAGTARIPFDSAYAAAHDGFFNAAHVSGLTQWATISGGHTSEKLINYLRGQTGNEMNAPAAADKLYRSRVTVMGDALESQPAFISKPLYRYVYAGYPEYKAAQADRKGTVFVGANDGMLHAFVGANSPDPNPVDPEIGGRERWAYVPSMVIPNMWKLADTDYSTKHINLVNGSPVIADICVTNCAGATASDWRTIVVAGLNGGGRGYYALDVTEPENPKLMWEFTTTAGIGKTKNDNLGYTFGRPVVARRASDGKWVVVLTSGHNNVGPGTGQGYLFVLDAASGTILDTYPTTAGDLTDPSGLASVSLWDESDGGNEAKFAYATDLHGNVWRFDITSAPSSSNPLKFATLKDGGSPAKPQPITTAPVLMEVGSHRVIVVATGKYLEVGDVTNHQTQSIYAIKDDVTTSTEVGNPRTAAAPKMVQQIITPNTNDTNRRDGTKKPVDFDTDLGWFIDFIDDSTGSERVNVSPKLVQGTLLVPTIVPASTACTPGGYGWFNYLNYSDGWPVGETNTNVSVKYDSPIVGFSFIFIDDKPVVLTVTADGNFDKDENAQFGSGGNLPGFTRHRSIWREVIPTR